MTNEQWECIYNAAYAASDAWKKDREDLTDRIRAFEREIKFCSDNRDYWKGLSEQREARITTLENELDELTAARSAKADLDPYTRLDSLERIVGVHEVNIYNLDTRVDKLEEANNALIKERDEAQSERDEAVKERDEAVKERASHGTYKLSREYWKNLYESERAHNYNLETENKRLRRTVEAS
jgi:FtsZ-binding cell division protein ZapB